MEKRSPVIPAARAGSPWPPQNVELTQGQNSLSVVSWDPVGALEQRPRNASNAAGLPDPRTTPPPPPALSDSQERYPLDSGVGGVHTRRCELRLAWWLTTGDGQPSITTTKGLDVTPESGSSTRSR